MFRKVFLILAAAAMFSFASADTAEAGHCGRGGYYGGGYRGGHHYNSYYQSGPRYRSSYYHGGPSYYRGGHGHGYGYGGGGGRYYRGSGVSFSIGF